MKPWRQLINNVFFTILTVVLFAFPALPEEPHSKLNILKEIRYWSNPDYTRVVIDSEGDFKYESHILDEDKKLGYPARLYIDIFDVHIASILKEPINIKDGLLRVIRCGIRSENTVRVVLDLEKRSDYRIFSLQNPSRLVIDIIEEKAMEKKEKEKRKEKKRLTKKSPRIYPL